MVKAGSAHRFQTLLGVCVLICVGVPFFLPHMHDRYFFLADVLSLALAVVMPGLFPVPVLVSFASLLGYHAYLKMRYLLPMRYGAAALGLTLVLTALYMAYSMAPQSQNSLQHQDEEK